MYFYAPCHACIMPIPRYASTPDKPCRNHHISLSNQQRHDRQPAPNRSEHILRTNLLRRTQERRNTRRRTREARNRNIAECHRAGPGEEGRRARRSRHGHQAHTNSLRRVGSYRRSTWLRPANCRCRCRRVGDEGDLRDGDLGRHDRNR